MNLPQPEENATIASVMSTLSTQPYKGTRDYYPEDKRIQNYIFNTWRQVVERFGYEEYGAPLLEPLELYAAKSGQELVNEQTYTFADRGGRTVAIRPEMTPTISRMVAARRQELAYPARLYSIANFMRYERPQRGREREFWQLNVDIFGVDSTAADIEIITIADTLLRQFGAKEDDYVIRVNSRTLISYIMTSFLGLDDVRAQQMVKLFDRRNKITEADFTEQMADITGDTSDELAAKVRQLVEARTLDELPEEIKVTEAVTELRVVFDGLRAGGVATALFDATLMRGLDYYTGTVFEVFDTHPDNNRSLFGGGRYDGLVGMFGAEPISAVGFAPGGTMMENFLAVRGLLPEPKSTATVYVVVIGDALEQANRIAAQLRDAGINTEVDITDRKIDKQIKTAVKKGIPAALFVGEADEDTGRYSLKNLAEGTEQSVALTEVIDILRVL